MNPGSEPADLSGWTLTDNDPTHVYTFPSGTIVPAGAYLVRSGDGDFAFGLGNGDSVILYDARGAKVDELVFGAHVSSMGRCPDGSGAFMPMTPSFGHANACP